MSINENVTKLAASLKDIYKNEIVDALTDMKDYLDKSSLSEDEKLKRYSEFSSTLRANMISETMSQAANVTIQDAQITEQKKVNTAQINLFNAQKSDVAQAEQLKKEQTTLAQKEQAKVTEETNQIKFSMYLAGIEAQVKTTFTVAQTLSEARKSGATVVKDARVVTLPTTGQTINYAHCTLTPASAGDLNKGVMGYQMNQLKHNADSFKNHTAVQVGNQMVQLVNSAYAEGLTNVGGLLSSHKALLSSLVGDVILDANYTTVN